MQLYVNEDREITKRMVQHAEGRGCRGLFITVDAPQLGRREMGTHLPSAYCVSSNASPADIHANLNGVASDGQKNNPDAIDRSRGAARNLWLHGPQTLLERHPVL